MHDFGLTVAIGVKDRDAEDVRTVTAPFLLSLSVEHAEAPTSVQPHHEFGFAIIVEIAERHGVWC